MNSGYKLLNFDVVLAIYMKLIEIL